MDNKRVARQLIHGLVDYWPLVEQSGARASLTGRHNLTDNNTVTGNPGLFGQASQFSSATLEYLSRSSVDEIQPGDIDFTLAAWVYMTDKVASFPSIVSKFNATGNQRAFWLRHTLGTDLFEFVVSTDGTTGGLATVTASNFGAPSAATWYLVVAWHDSQNNHLGIQVDDASHNETAHSTGVFATSTASFNIGSQGTTGNPWNGRIASVGYWKRILMPSERDYIYNNGLGRPLFCV